MKGLEDVGKLFITNDVTSIRLQLFKHGEKEFSKLKKYAFYGGVPKENKEKALSYWKKTILSRIYMEGINFEASVSPRFWWHGIETTGIACDLFQVNIVIFSLPSPKTIFFIHYENNIIHKVIVETNVINIMDMYKNNKFPTIYLIHCNDSHYKFYSKK